jgi:hypothetical protein
VKRVGAVPDRIGTGREPLLPVEIRKAKLEIRNSRRFSNFDFRISVLTKGAQMREKDWRVSKVWLGLLIFSLAVAAAALARHWGPSEFLSRGDPMQFEDTHPTTESVARQAGYHRGLVEGAARPHYVHVVARHKDGTVFYDQWFHNLRTNAGINWQYNQMAGTTAAVCTYFALSNDSGTPAATDTAVASEITTNGLARANATAAHTSNATSYTLSYTFTATGTQSAQKIGVLNASSGGTLCFENTFTQVSMVSGDTLAVTYTINF